MVKEWVKILEHLRPDLSHQGTAVPGPTGHACLTCHSRRGHQTLISMHVHSFAPSHASEPQVTVVAMVPGLGGGIHFSEGTAPLARVTCQCCGDFGCQNCDCPLVHLLQPLSCSF